MSGLKIYALVCDADGCIERFINFRLATLSRARVEAARLGWVHRIEPLPGGFCAPSKDYCPGHAAPPKDGG